eukprot:jgi/Ulvmu1/11132/UM071_0015.1
MPERTGAGSVGDVCGIMLVQTVAALRAIVDVFPVFFLGAAEALIYHSVTQCWVCPVHRETQGPAGAYVKQRRPLNSQCMVTCSQKVGTPRCSIERSWYCLSWPFLQLPGSRQMSGSQSGVVTASSAVSENSVAGHVASCLEVHCMSIVC